MNIASKNQKCVISLSATVAEAATIFTVTPVAQPRASVVIGGHSIGVFVYWYGPVRTVTKSIRLLVLLGLDRLTVGPGRNRLLGTGPFLMWFAVELSNSRSTEWYTPPSIKCRKFMQPVQHFLFLKSF
jgi:hypothetical protein